MENGKWSERFGNVSRSVPGATLLFRRQCFKDTGGYIPLKYGGEDTVAGVVARMHGWGVESFPDLKVYHHRRTRSGDGNHLSGRFREGEMDYSIGSHPLYQSAKIFSRLWEKPYLFGSLTRASGYFWASLCREARIVPEDVVHFLRKEQLELLKSLLPGLLRLSREKLR